jgi:hypothetical protein
MAGAKGHLRGYLEWQISFALACYGMSNCHKNLVQSRQPLTLFQVQSTIGHLTLPNFAHIRPPLHTSKDGGRFFLPVLHYTYPEAAADALMMAWIAFGWIARSLAERL